jgi:hypothetical protein
MLQDDDEAYEDLIWSVGGSPPYGGISNEEAEAVYHLIENYRGQGMATPSHYAAVRKFLKDHPDREQVLDLFRYYDEIVSDSESYPIEAADRGLAIAESIGQPGPVGLFKLFQAGVLSREGRNAQAASRTLDGLGLLLEAAEGESAAAHRVAQAAQNAVALTAAAGDLTRATKLLEELSEVLPGDASAELQRWIEARR